jgi:hypothetical protein
MVWFWHILVAVALMVASMPCCHAVDHDAHRHADEATTQLCGNHDCHCHSCDAMACKSKRSVQMERFSVPVSLIPPVAEMQLFVYPETNTLPRHRPLTSCAALASIQTVQLLI